MARKHSMLNLREINRNNTHTALASMLTYHGWVSLILSRVLRLYKMGFGLTAGFIGLWHTYPQLQCTPLQHYSSSDNSYRVSQPSLYSPGPRTSCRPNSLCWLFSEDCCLTSELPWLYSLRSDRREDTFSKQIPKKHPLVVTK
jgi:hypothetical protein